MWTKWWSLVMQLSLMKISLRSCNSQLPLKNLRILTTLIRILLQENDEFEWWVDWTRTSTSNQFLIWVKLTHLKTKMWSWRRKNRKTCCLIYEKPNLKFKHHKFFTYLKICLFRLNLDKNTYQSFPYPLNETHLILSQEILWLI